MARDRHSDELDAGFDGVTAQPSERADRRLRQESDDKVVPMENVGGAQPTALGLDSGGNFPGSEDDLANLSEPEPAEAPELDAVHVRDDPDDGGR